MGEQSTDPLGLGGRETLLRPAKQTLKLCAAKVCFHVRPFGKNFSRTNRQTDSEALFQGRFQLLQAPHGIPYLLIVRLSF